jgi:methyltransferase (TIGR00027 family)
MEPVIRDISDTARWVAIFRAEESERADAVFRDPFARRLAGERGAQIADAIEFGRSNSWTFVARTFLFDEVVTHHIGRGFDTIVNLAAGLDTRPYRLELPGSLSWVEIDLPAMIAYKTAMLATETPACDLRRIALDLSDRKQRQAVFDDVARRADSALVISEGLIGYLKEEEAASLAADLSCERSFRRWALDLLSPGLLAMAQEQIGSFLEAARAPLVFAPEDGEEFFHRYGWSPVESKSHLSCDTQTTVGRDARVRGCSRA